MSRLQGEPHLSTPLAPLSSDKIIYAQILASHLIPVDFVFQKALTIYSHRLAFETAQIRNEAFYSESLTNDLKVIISRENKLYICDRL